MATANPPWLREESVEPLKAPESGPSSPAIQRAKVSKNQLLFWVLKVVTMLLCVLMACTAIIGFQSISGVEAPQKIFIVVYMLFFSTLLFMHELIEIRPIEWVDHMMRRNFGFLYGALGKSFYIIFIAFLSFGLGDPESLTMATGSGLGCFGFVQLGLYLKYPEMFEEA